MRESLRIKRPEAMEDYLDVNGWHFNKNSAEYACSLMYKRDENGKREYIEPITQEDLRQMFMRYKLEIDEEDIWDALYLANMCKSDLMDGDDAAIEDEEHLVRFVKRTLYDPDAPDGTVFARWYATMCRKGIRPDWEDLL